MLWTELGPQFLDKATFVPNVAGVIAAWCDVLGTRLEDDKFAAWTEDLIDKLQPIRSVKLHVQVCSISMETLIWAAITSIGIQRCSTENYVVGPVIRICSQSPKEHHCRTAQDVFEFRNRLGESLLHQFPPSRRGEGLDK
jgi:hypothetical protein